MDTSWHPSQSIKEMEAVIRLAQTCKCDIVHIQQVTQFALSLFDALQPIHKYGSMERTWLEMAGILHDIGWIDGREGHHKSTLKIILNSPMLDLPNKERLIVGSIARYHRKTLPCLDHDHFAVLEPDERQTVAVMASMLRLADGLDHLGNQKIHSIMVESGHKSVTISCKVIAYFSNKPVNVPKSDLFEMVFERKVKIKWSVLL